MAPKNSLNGLNRAAALGSNIGAGRVALIAFIAKARALVASWWNTTPGTGIVTGNSRNVMGILLEGIQGVVEAVKFSRRYSGLLL
jgi:hypothetical protein